MDASNPEVQPHSTTSPSNHHDRLHDFLNGDTHSHASPPSSSASASISASYSISNNSYPAALIPPYWKHHRHASEQSLDTKPPHISLEDHTGAQSETSSALWARSVTIEDYVVVKGPSGIGAYVVWNCKVQTLDGGPMMIRKRYSEFDDLRRKLLATFPNAGQAMPPLPPKSIVYKYRPRFLETRRVGLEYFLNCILLNPEFSGSPVLKEFLFS